MIKVFVSILSPVCLLARSLLRASTNALMTNNDAAPSGKDRA